MRNWELIAVQLKSDPSVIPVLNRAQILDDCLSLTRSSLLPYSFVLDLIEYLPKTETEFVPWQSVLNSLQYLSDMLQHTPVYTDFQVSNVPRQAERNQGGV